MSDFRTVFPGVYNDREQKMLDELNAQLETMVGKPAMMADTDADKTFMLLYANAWDPWNPLYNDEKYAEGTKYGGIIAIPCWKEPGGMFPTLPMNFGDKLQRANDGGAFEMFAPVRPGDTFTSKIEAMIVSDETPADGSETRTFRLEGRSSLYNQNGELVIRGITRGHNGFKSYKDDFTGDKGGLLDGGGPPKGGNAPGGGMSGGGPGGPPGMRRDPIHNFTEEDWEYISDLWRKEYIRGEEKLFWEDVNIGDEPAWTCSGPFTEMDLIKGHGLQVMGRPPLRDTIITKEGRERMKPFADAYGIYYFDTAAHYCHRNQDGSRAMFYNTTGRNMLVRLVTNWMGNDGWLRYLDWHFMGESGVEDSFLAKVPSMKGKWVNHHGMASDCIICKGYVTDKYINENGEHMADLVCWAETIDGGIAQVVLVKVVLESRG